MGRRLRLLVIAIAIAGGLAARVPAPAAAQDVPPVDHVFVYVMENTNYGDVIGNPGAPFLNQLAQDWLLATDYYATGHASLDNYIAMTSGQLPNPATSSDCFVYFSAVCILDVDNVADQLEAAGWDWKGYMDNMPGPCVHTEENTVETNQNGYSTRHNPFMYYRSIVDDQARCDAHDVPMTELWDDLAAGTVPAYSFLTPDSCHDGHDSGASCERGGGVAEADWFASITLPRIMADPIFEHSLIFVTFDENGFADDEKPPLNIDNQTPDFGGNVYMVMVSPRVAKGTETDTTYDHFSQLKTVQDIFCLPYIAGTDSEAIPSMISLIDQQRCALPDPTTTASDAATTSPAHDAAAQESTAVAGSSDQTSGALAATGWPATLLLGAAVVAAGLGLATLRRRAA